MTVRHDLPADLGPSVTLTIYRVVQEGLINALRHAQASRVEINLESHESKTGQQMVVTISDDGVGLPEQWSRPGHFGLRGLADRVERLNGTLLVNNRQPRGVRLTADIPLTAGS